MKRLFCITVCLLLTGCAGTRGLDSSAVIKAVAFDAAEEGFLLTACVLNPDGDEPYITIEAEAKSMTDALALLSATTERTPYLAQNEVIVLSDSLGGQTAADIIDFFSGFPESAGVTLLCAARGRAADILSYSEGLYKEPAVDISRTLKNAAETDGSVLLTLDGAHGALTGAAGCCMIPTGEMPEDSESFTVTGAGILGAKGYSGQLTNEELLGAKWLLSEGAHACFTVESCAGSAGIRLSRVRTEINTAGFDRFDFTCSTSAEYSLLQGSAADGDVEAYMKKCMAAAFERAQRDGDFMGLSGEAYNKSEELRHALDGDIGRAMSSARLVCNVTVRAVGGGFPRKGVL